MSKGLYERAEPEPEILLGEESTGSGLYQRLRH